MQTDVPPRPAEPETKKQAAQPQPEPMATEESEDAKAAKERKANAVAEKEKGYERVWSPHIFRSVAALTLTRSAVSAAVITRLHAAAPTATRSATLRTR